MSHRFADSLRAGAFAPYDGQRNCPKHVEFHSKINLRNSAPIWIYYKVKLKVTIALLYHMQQHSEFIHFVQSVHVVNNSFAVQHLLDCLQMQRVYCERERCFFVCL